MNTLKDENLKIKRLIEVDKKLLPPDGGTNFNRLIFAKSPYLLQHAENPVDWHPWSEEAFDKARNEDKPIFLSIGYATCHWCHVMEHESFEDEEVAKVINRHFVPIKVDREERPDVDDQFMTVAQMALEGGAGWPLSVFLDHEKKPFYVATYLPRVGRSGMPGIIDVLENIADVWRNKRDVVETTCASIIKELSTKSEPTPAAIPENGVLADASRHLEQIFDREWGGFGTSPKFPRPVFLSYLLRTYKRNGDAKALEMADHSLRTMRKGGIFDQIGFGFHRYSVDQKWLVPHFEKMLYDQGMLSITYLEAYQATGDQFHRDVAEEIFNFVQREMTSPEGGFYSAIDADSEGSEGNFYLWTCSEVQNILEMKDCETVCSIYDISEEGNFEGKNIPNLKLFPGEYASKAGMTETSICNDLERLRLKLLAAREKRIKPLRDEKILASWNGLMIAALAKGYSLTGNRSYLEAAESSLNFVKNRLFTADGRLLRSFYAGESEVPAFLEDYTFLVWGLIELYGATLKAEFLNDAVSLSKECLRLFADDFSYGLYDSGADAENILIRKKSTADGVIPSGNSVAAMNFLRLGKITARKNFIKEGEGILRALMGDLLAQPISYLHAAAALDYLRGIDVDITLVGKPDDPETEEMIRSISSRIIPGLVLRLKDPEMESGEYKTLGGRTAAYICSDGICRPPVAGREGFEKILGEVLA